MSDASDRLAQVFIWKEGNAPDVAYARQVLQAVNPEAAKAVASENPPLQLFSVMGHWPEDLWARALTDMRAIPAPGGTTWIDTSRYDLAGWQGTDQRSGDRIFVVTAFRRAAAPIDTFRGAGVGAPQLPPPSLAQVPYYPQYPTGPLGWPPQGQQSYQYPQYQQVPMTQGYNPMTTGPLSQVTGNLPVIVGPLHLDPSMSAGYGGYAPFYASFGTRLSAALIDIFFVGILQALVIFAATLARPNTGRGDAVSVLLAYSPYACLGAGLFAAYHVLQWTLWGQTFGKRLMRIKVVTAQGEVPGFGRSLLRLLGYGFSFSIAGWGFLLAALDPRRQALHDKIAETFVVPESPAIEPPTGLPGYTPRPSTQSVATPLRGGTPLLTTGPALGMAAVASAQPFGVAQITPTHPEPQQAGTQNLTGGALPGATAPVDGGQPGTNPAETSAYTTGSLEGPPTEDAVHRGDTTLSNLPGIVSGPVTDVLLSQSMGESSERFSSYGKARELFKSALAEMEIGVRSGLQGYRVEPGAARAAAALFKEALSLVPNSIAYHYYYAVALRYAEGFEVAIGEFRQVLEKDPSHYEARQQVLYGPRWHDAFAYPLWLSPAPVEIESPLPVSVSSLLPAGQQQGTRLVLLREGASKVVAALSRTPRKAWATMPTSDMPARLDIVLSRTPFGPIIALYVVVQDDPGNPYIGETFLNPHDPGHPSDDACQLGQHMLEQLARREGTFLIFADDDNRLLMSRRLLFDSATQVTVARVLYEVQTLPPQVMDAERFRQAAQWHMEHYSLEQIKR